MIFLGDIACPASKVKDFTACVERMPFFENEIVVLNLEAVIADEKQSSNVDRLFNSKHVLDGFRKAQKVIVSLANNHMYDFPELIKPTVEFLKKNGIGVFGLCEDDGSVLPYEYETVSGNKYAFFGHCWRLYTKTNTNRVNHVRVVDSDYGEFVNIVSCYINKNPNTTVYCVMHWNYDMEILPFPMHIKVARKLVDNGVSAVVGSHSHVAQAAELYKGKPIAYGLGNFYLPSGIFFRGKLNYPDISRDTYSLVIDSDDSYVQWFRTDDTNLDVPIALKNKENFDGDKILSISQNVSLEEKQYESYFRKRRSKKLFVPVFTDYIGQFFELKEIWAINRVKIIKIIKG